MTVNIYVRTGPKLHNNNQSYWHRFNNLYYLKYFPKRPSWYFCFVLQIISTFLHLSLAHRLSCTPFFYFLLTNTLLLISCPSPAAVKTSSTTVSGTSPWAKWPSRAPRRLSHLPSLKSPMKSWTPWRSRSHTSAARFRERRYRRCALIQISACRYSEVDASSSWICAVVSPISVWKLKQDYFFFVFFVFQAVQM